MLTFEVIAIGNEILSGHVVNSNAAFISYELQQLGFKCVGHGVLPDEESRLEAELRDAMDRSDLVVTTGGLGPTLDDRTRRVLARLFDCELVPNPEVIADLESRYGSQLISLMDQATIPLVAEPLLNPVGTAPALVLRRANAMLIVLPGVPQEMKVLLCEKVLPKLKDMFPNQILPRRKILGLVRHTESSLDPILRDLQSAFPELELGIYPSNGILQVHLLERQLDGASRIDEAEAELKQKLGGKLFSDQGRGLSAAIQDRFIDRAWTLSCAESCTGGYLSSCLTSVPGSSQYFLGSVVSYSNQLKHDLLNVPLETLQHYGAVSKETVQAMAEGVRARTSADFSLAISGVAGPGGGSDEKPVGLVHLALASRSAPTFTWKIQVQGNRERVIIRSANEALAELWMQVVACPAQG